MKLIRAMDRAARFAALGLCLVGCASGRPTGGDEAAMRAMRGPWLDRSAQASHDATTGAPAAAAGADEELWVITKPPTAGASAAAADTPGTGSLLAAPAGRTDLVPLPLRHTEVKASVSGGVASVDVAQRFTNPYDGKIEAVYVFPLPEDAAVSEFVMTVGDRRIRGIIRERAEAERLYQQARRQGHAASLLTQERPNVFTQRIANLEPGKEIEARITYFHSLPYRDGWYELVFPMVVGPRFNPPSPASGARAGASPVEVVNLPPGERSGHDIGFTAEVEAGVAFEAIECDTHRVHVRRRSETTATVALDDADAIPNRDLVLRYRVAGERSKAGLLVHRAPDGERYFALSLVAPAPGATLARAAMELVLVLDDSGSMAGYPLEKAKTAAEAALRRLGPGDTFQLITFADAATLLSPAPLAATPANVDAAVRHLRGIGGGGGTMMMEGVRAALAVPHEERRLRFVALFTDGFIGNEAEVLGEVGRRLGASRLFSFGVGSSVNRYLLERLAGIGRGAVAYVGPEDDAAAVMDAFWERVSRPAATDLAIDWGGLETESVYPARLPDLFAGRSVVMLGRLRGGPDRGTITVTGRAGEERVRLEAPFALRDEGASRPALAALWAGRRIEDLTDRLLATTDGTDLKREITDVALRHGLVSPFTAFVAVDALSRTAGDYGTTINVPVPLPAGVRYPTGPGE